MSDATSPDAPELSDSTPPVGEPVGDRGGSRRWRSVWRIHFYAGMFSIPFLLLMAVTGLVILYTTPLQNATEGDLRQVKEVGEWVSFDAQEKAVEAAYPEETVIFLQLPVDDETSTIFGFDSGHQAYVNPYTGEVLGKNDPGRGVVGLSNRLHAFLNNEQRKLSLPTVSALWDDGPVMRDYVIGDLILETLGVWTIVLAITGLYIWWPRTSRHGGAERTGRGWFNIRLGKKGRAKWRDLHAVPGVVLSGLVLVTIVSGLGWSTYWGPNFTALANEISPNVWPDAPASGQVTRSDFDILGNQITWNTGNIPIPSSYATVPDGTQPVPMTLDSIVDIGNENGMKPGFYVFFPANDVDEAGNPVYGAFDLSNNWPRKTGEARNLALDQFTGETLQDLNAYGLGTVSYAMDTMVSWHMGTQWGIVTRIFMTMLCVLTIWSIVSALVMYFKRRRKGTLGLPRRPIDLRMSKHLTVISVALALVFPQWGVTALGVLAVDRFVIRKVPRLRLAFGQR
ncbi:MAG: PepSY domain-containing protein [Ilumatobacteraceae bacterium]